METQYWIGITVDCGYLDRERAAAPKATCEEIGRLLGSMIAKADKFSNPEALQVREEQAEYFTTTED